MLSNIPHYQLWGREQGVSQIIPYIGYNNLSIDTTSYYQVGITGIELEAKNVLRSLQKQL